MATTRKDSPEAPNPSNLGTTPTDPAVPRTEVGGKAPEKDKIITASGPTVQKPFSKGPIQ